jgi:Zn-dependent M16 (insulinase) family peptidase
MKGALTAPSTRLAEELNSVLYPDLTYGINSGGDPKVIPDLTYEELLAFHKKFYHPSRCYFFFYGNIPVEKHLEFLSNKLLHGVEKQPKLPPMPLQKRYSSPIYHKGGYPIATEGDGKVLSAIGWLTCQIKEEATLLAIQVLMSAIANTDASPVKVALLRSGLCKSASCSIDSEVSEIPVIFSFKGCEEGSIAQIEKVLLGELAKLRDEGISKYLIDNALHQIELARSEIGGNGYPFGLMLYFRSILAKQHGASIEDGLRIHTTFAKLKELLGANPRYFEELLDRYFVQNSHRVAIEMVPDSTLEAKEQADETALLEKIRKSLSEGEKSKLLSQAKELQKYQEEQEEADIDVLPKVTLADVPKASKDFSIDRCQIDGIEVYSHSCFTNGLTYVDMVYNLPEIAEEKLPLVKLLATLIPQLGSGGLSYIKTMEAIQSCSGGVGCTIGGYSHAEILDSIAPTIALQSYSLHRTNQEMLRWMKAFIESVDFTDIDRIKEVVLKQYTQLDSSLNQSGMRYATNLVYSALSPNGAINYAWHGLGYFHFLKDIALSLDSKIGSVIEELKKLYRMIFAGQAFDLVITDDQEEIGKLIENRFYGLYEGEERERRNSWQPSIQPLAVAPQGRFIASQVAFSAKACSTVPYVHEAAPAILLASSLMENVVLHPRIREQGGAYGAGASCNITAGKIHLYSYRDPHIKLSSDAFLDAVKAIVNGDFSEEDLEEAKLEAIQDLDAPVSPGSRAEVVYTWLRQGKTLAMRQKFREAILSMDKKAVQQAVEQFLLKPLETAPLVVFSGKNLLEKENATLEPKLALCSI